MFFYTRKILAVLFLIAVASIAVATIHCVAVASTLVTLSCVLQLCGVLESVPGEPMINIALVGAGCFVVAIGAAEYAVISWYKLPEVTEWIYAEATAKPKMRYVR